ncbi:MAG: ThiF family adenylyltransferase [Thermoleophilaceae bacterium]
MRTWVHRFPERREQELEEFRERGLAFAVDEQALDRDARLLLRGAVRWREADVALLVAYPDAFPYLPPQVHAPDLRLGRHQHPYDGNLCLLDDSPGAWGPEQTGAWLVAERVPYLLELTEQGGEALRRGEAPQGEPLSMFFHRQLGSAVLVPSAALDIDPDVAGGSGRIACSSAEPPRLVVRGLVSEVVAKTASRKTKVVARADAGLLRRFGGGQIPFRWVRLAEPPAGDSAAELLAAAEAVRPGSATPPWHTVAGGQIAVCGVVFPEEVTQGQFEDGWLFAVKVRCPNGEKAAPYIAHTDRLTPRDMGARIPRLSGLADKHVAVVGLGAIGSELALELARAQIGELRLLDFDSVEAGTVIRWPTGLTAVGHSKVQAVGGRIEAEYPFTDVIGFQRQLGATALEPRRGETDLDLLDRLLDGIDLLVDASANLNVQQLLAAMADERGVPQLYVSATEGARGGIVAPVVPGRTGCWMCLQWHLQTGSVQMPPRDIDGTVEPRGCGSRTFAGARFDLLPVVAQAARSAVSVLRGGSREHVDVCSLPDPDLGIAPVWSSRPLTTHPNCPYCGAAAAAA